MRTDLLRFNGAVQRDPAIDAWMKKHRGELVAIAQQWFEVMRKCGDEVRELLHDGCPVACLGGVPFAYVNVFTAHVNVGFFQGATLPDPARLLQGAGKFMRHVKLRPGTATDTAALTRLIETAWADIKARVENGWRRETPQGNPAMPLLSRARRGVCRRRLPDGWGTGKPEITLWLTTRQTLTPSLLSGESRISKGGLIRPIFATNVVSVFGALSCPA